MSRGFGRVQRAIVAYLDTEPFGRDHTGRPVAAATWWLAEVVYGHDGHEHNGDGRVFRQAAQATEAQRTAVRRALLGLERSGKAQRETECGVVYWRRPDP